MRGCVLLLFVAVCLVRADCPEWIMGWLTRAYSVFFHTSVCVPVGEKTSAVLLCFAVRDVAPAMSHFVCDIVAHQLPQPSPAHTHCCALCFVVRDISDFGIYVVAHRPPAATTIASTLLRITTAVVLYSTLSHLSTAKLSFWTR